MMAILGVLFAVVYMAVFYGGTAISVALTPLGLSAFGFELIYGVWFMAATIAAYIIRKPGAALITEVLASAIELLMGNSGGATVVLTGLIQGVGCELGFAVFRYRKYNLLSMALSGVFAAVCIFCYELYYLSYYLLAPTMLAAQLAVRFASAVVFSGVIAKLFNQRATILHSRRVYFSFNSSRFAWAAERLLSKALHRCALFLPALRMRGFGSMICKNPVFLYHK